MTIYYILYKMKMSSTLIVPSAKTLTKQSLINRIVSVCLPKNEIIYGVLNNWSSCSTLNPLILIGKYFLYRKGLKSMDSRRGWIGNLLTRPSQPGGNL